MNGLLISAIHKSSGKTTVTVGIAAALNRRGIAVQTFKKGPDYIDPMWLSRAAGRPCRNLDFYTMSADEIGAAFTTHAQDADVSIVEGNKGLFDGVDVEGSDSNAALVELLGVPVVLVVDTRGMTRGIAPLITGYEAFAENFRIAGVILNQVGGPRHESKLCAALERYTDMPVLGAIGRYPEMSISERHLGLTPVNESREADDKVSVIADIIEQHVDLENLGVAACDTRPAAASNVQRLDAVFNLTDVRIAVARDRAFGFYYPDDLDAFAAAGAELMPFDATRDARLPDADGLFIGGGFPEVHAAALAANTALRHDIRDALAAGMPAYAECGGLMYLSQALEWQGARHQMVGFLPGTSVIHDRPVGRGYVKLRETDHMPWPSQAGDAVTGSIVKAHEFHYAALEGLPADMNFAFDVKRGHGIDGDHDGIVQNNTLATFAHQRQVGDSRWVARFVAHVRAHAVRPPMRRAGFGRF